MNTTIHRARKEHNCWHYWSTACAGTGRIAKGELYYCPADDCESPFQPYRTCEACMCNRVNIIDSRNVIARIEELNSDRDALEGEELEAFDSSDKGEELRALHPWLKRLRAVLKIGNMAPH